MPLSRNFVSMERKRPEGRGTIQKNRGESVTQNNTAWSNSVYYNAMNCVVCKTQKIQESYNYTSTTQVRWVNAHRCDEQGLEWFRLFFTQFADDPCQNFIEFVRFKICESFETGCRKIEVWTGTGFFWGLQAKVMSTDKFWYHWIYMNTLCTLVRDFQVKASHVDSSPRDSKRVFAGRRCVKRCLWRTLGDESVSNDVFW